MIRTWLNRWLALDGLEQRIKMLEQRPEMVAFTAPKRDLSMTQEVHIPTYSFEYMANAAIADADEAVQ